MDNKKPVRSRKDTVTLKFEQNRVRAPLHIHLVQTQALDLTANYPRCLFSMKFGFGAVA